MVNFNPKLFLYGVKVSTYQANEEQCGQGYLYTANGSYTPNHNLNDTIGWCAISRDLKKSIMFNDTIILLNPNGFKKYYIVKDLTSSKLKNTVDLLTDGENNLFYSNILIK